ncbi:MAG TPA: FeoA family protein [Ignavibacteriaceae bacterium]|nr:FeoA family protein [Ignavibacteriaceae bacterium]
MRTAADLKYGEKVTINDIDITHPSSVRILEVGFTPGQEIELITMSAFNDPLAFAVRGSLIAIRKSEARCIKIV